MPHKKQMLNLFWNWKKQSYPKDLFKNQFDICMLAVVFLFHIQGQSAITKKRREFQGCMLNECWD